MCIYIHIGKHFKDAHISKHIQAVKDHVSKHPRFMFIIQEKGGENAFSHAQLKVIPQVFKMLNQSTEHLGDISSLYIKDGKQEHLGVHSVLYTKFYLKIEDTLKVH